MISTSKKFIFIHYPKTGGNSIQDALRKFSDDDFVVLNHYQDGVERFQTKNSKFPLLEKHSKLSDYEGALRKNIFDFSIFITLRNPFDRLISFYFSPHRNKTTFERKDFSSFIDTVKPLEHFVKSKYNVNHKINFLKYETLSKDFQKMLVSLKIDKIDLPHRNKSKLEKGSYKSYYDDELIAKVSNMHKLELSLGKYDF